jgi:hypothetical protein
MNRFSSLLKSLLVFVAFVIVLAGAQQAFSQTDDDVPGKVAQSTTLPASFSNFGIARELRANQSVTGGALAPGESFVYKIEALPANQLHVSARFVGNSQARVQLSLYNTDGLLLSRDVKQMSASSELNVYYLRGFSRTEILGDEDVVFIEFENVSTGSTAGVDSYSFTPTVISRSDIDTAFDAADTIQDALELDAGEYESNHIAYNACVVSQFCSTDAIDTYKFLIPQGTVLRVVVDPSAQLSLSPRLINASLTLLDSASALNGQAAQLSYTAENGDEMVYVVIEGDPSNDYFGTYELAVTTDLAQVPAPVPTPTEPSPTQPIPPVQDAEEGESQQPIDQVRQFVQDQYLYVIAAGLALIIIFFIIVLLWMRRRRRRKAEQPLPEMGPPGLPTAPASSGSNGMSGLQLGRQMSRTPESPRDPNMPVGRTAEDLSLPGAPSQPSSWQQFDQGAPAQSSQSSQSSDSGQQNSAGPQR